MKSIYICTTGEYDEYRICGVFDNKTAAKKFCKHFGCGIEKWILNPFASELAKNYFPYFVRMSKDGNVISIDENPSFFGFGDSTKIHGFDIHKNMYLYCMAESPEHAVKIANEFRINLITSNKWTR